MHRSRSGISPVVATVILVAIAIVIAIAVAFWATGLVGVFTRFEKIEITAAYYDPDQGGVILHVRNTGSADATIDDVYVNGRPSGVAGFSVSGTGPLTVGQNTTITVTGTFIPGVTYELAVHTASGKTYPVAVLIP
ncbi:MAG: archaellin/type IV pilin N-terminal domain-containing protein [Nitrososphaerota archaeon]|nr:archaellin/type IV pilin N-terminal domain-containing protein [Nitrososphaerota archaeon]